MEETYYLQDGYIEEDSDDDFSYREVMVDDALLSSGEEDLETALQNIQAATQPAVVAVPAAEPTTATRHPEIVEDFVRNFMVRMGMVHTAECFQAEWYELSQSGQLKGYQAEQLPDVYSQHRQLEGVLEGLREELHGYQEAAKVAKEKYVRLKKERDYHRMHHRRVLQEKGKLLADIKRMKQHFSTYEPMVQELKQKYEAVTKEKMLACLERDRALSEVGCLHSTLQSVQQQETQPARTGKGPAKPSSEPKQDKVAEVDQSREKGNAHLLHTQTQTEEIPAEPSNPHHHATMPVCTHLTRTGGLQQSHTIQAHDFAISSLCLHPSKDVLVTGSDDHTWRMWALPNGELLMTGQGHEDWLAQVDFHPSGSQLATASGDGTVKVWDFARGECVLTFSDHQQPVWGCSWHWSGDFLVSGGMDHCCKIWDTHRGQCLVSLRGHADSVNAVSFLPFSNTICSCSADKTLSLWDARTGLCMQTYYGHQHSCNDVSSTLQGLDLYSSDCFGTVLHWDMRTHSLQDKWDFGPHAVNALALDPAGAILACAGGDTTLKLVETTTAKVWSLAGHTHACPAVTFNNQADTLLSADSSGTVILWQ